MHVSYVTVNMAAPGAGSATRGGQECLYALHRFQKRCGFGDDELVDANAQGSFQNFNFFQDVVGDVVGDVILTMGYDCFGANGSKPTGAGPDCNWAREVLRAANIEAEWSEREDAAFPGGAPPMAPVRKVVGRTAAVVRFPFCVPGFPAAMTAVQNLPRGY